MGQKSLGFKRGFSKQLLTICKLCYFHCLFLVSRLFTGCTGCTWCRKGRVWKRATNKFKASKSKYICHTTKKICFQFLAWRLYFSIFPNIFVILQQRSVSNFLIEDCISQYFQIYLSYSNKNLFPIFWLKIVFLNISKYICHTPTKICFQFF